MEIGDTMDIRFEVPASARNEDGSIKEDFYEFLFNMLGKEYGGATAMSMEIIEG